MQQDISIQICQSPSDFKIAKQLTIDYFEWLGMDLEFQNTDKEFESFNVMYGEPKGCFIYATINDEVVGGVATRYLEEDICEMKRLYIYDKFQGQGIGRLLCERIIEISKDLGYQKMRLDTISKLESANGLYERMKFYDIPAYYSNPDPTVRYMEKNLNSIFNPSLS